MADYQVIPLAGVAAQTLSIQLGNQPCSIDVFTKHIQVPVIPGHGVNTPPQFGGSILTVPPVYAEVDPVFLNLRINDALVLGGALARNNVKILRNPYFSLVGDLSFTDTEGDEDPQWPGLGTRWLLLYWPSL